MKIPHWAESAFQSVRPKPPAWSGPAGQADTIALERWEGYTERFRSRWTELDAEQWKTDGHREGGQARYHILLAALECARRLSVDDNPLKVIGARRRLLDLENKISDAAQTLEILFRERDDLQNQYGVASWCDRAVDPIRLWDALQLCFEGPAEDPERSFLGNSDIGKAIRVQLDTAQTTSRPVPRWADVLQQLGQRSEGMVEGELPVAGANVGNTNKTTYSPWCKSLIVMLRDWRVLDCLTNDQLCDLASVAFDTGRDGKINASQIGALRRKVIAGS